MKAHWLIAVSSMAVLLAGCETAENVNSDPSRNYDADKYECERNARLAVGAKSSKPTPREVKNLKDQCMKARGWRQVGKEQTR
jgi:hypothetical protein